MHKVLVSFTDDVNGGIYWAGHFYPKKGSYPTQARIAFLGSDKTSFGRPVIELPKSKKNAHVAKTNEVH